MGTLETKTSLEELHELVKVALTLVKVDEALELVSVDDNVETTDLGEAELLGLDAQKVDLLPDLGRVGLAGGVDGSLVLLQLDEDRREARIVGNVVEEDLGSLIETVVVAAVTDGLDLRNVGHVDKLLEVREAVSLGKSKDELRLDVGLTRVLAGHLEVLDEVLILVEALGAADNLAKVGRVGGLDVRVDGLLDHAVLELGLGELGPDLGLVAALGKLVGTVDRANVVEENLDRTDVDIVLFEDGEGLLVQLGADGNVGNVGSVKVVLFKIKGFPTLRTTTTTTTKKKTQRKHTRRLM